MRTVRTNECGALRSPEQGDERKELDRRSNELALSILEASSPRQRDRLMTAMGEVERLLQASMVCFAIKT